MTLTPTTTPCCLGTFEGFNHRSQSAIEAVLTAAAACMIPCSYFDKAA